MWAAPSPSAFAAHPAPAHRRGAKVSMRPLRRAPGPGQGCPCRRTASMRLRCSLMSAPQDGSPRVAIEWCNGAAMWLCRPTSGSEWNATLLFLSHLSPLWARVDHQPGFHYCQTPPPQHPSSPSYVEWIVGDPDHRQESGGAR